jgi:hypothetical protein
MELALITFVKLVGVGGPLSVVSVGIAKHNKNENDWVLAFIFVSKTSDIQCVSQI